MIIQPQRGCANRRRAKHAPIPLGCLHSSGLFHQEPRAISLGDEQMRASLHAELGGISKKLECPPIITGGIEDHIHLLARFGRTITQADWVKELKRVSNLWLKEQFHLSAFEWQAGYADFSVSESNLERVKRYIVNQKEHHKKRTFQDEVRELLRRHRMEWDERYIWD
jgi:putative transposase